QACLSALETLLSPPFTSIEVASFMRFTVTGSVNGMPPPKGLYANLHLLPAGAGVGDQAKALPRTLWHPPSRRSRDKAETFGPIDRAPDSAPAAGAKCHYGRSYRARRVSCRCRHLRSLDPPAMAAIRLQPRVCRAAPDRRSAQDR